MRKLGGYPGFQIKTQAQRRKKTQEEAVGSWCLECGGWVGTQCSLDLPQIVWLSLGRTLSLRFPSLFKELQLSFTNICLGSAYHQESNAELAPYSSPCLKFVGAISSYQGWCTGLIVLRAAPRDTKMRYPKSMPVQAAFHSSF